jgi:hypothetical protein
MGRELSKKAEVLGGYFKDHISTMEKLNDQLMDLSRDIERFSEQVGEMEKQKSQS